MKTWTLYDENRYVTGGVVQENQPENATDVLVTENWAKPRFNEDFTEVFNDATTAEQAEYELEQRKLQYADATEVYEDITAGLTDAALNDRYPDVSVGFVAYSTNGTVLYRKVSTETWFKINLA